MRIVIATDAWRPQINGVVTTLEATARELSARGHEVRIISTQGLLTLACPSYPEIRLAVWPGSHVARELKAFRPHAIHIATEGPLGMAVRRYCVARRVPFTSAYHTRYPEYLRARWPIPPSLTYTFLRRFHGSATRTFVSSPSLARQLTARRFAHLHLWRRGVDLACFRPGEPHALLKHLPRPLMISVGRVAIEKNLESFLSLPVPGTKLVVGDGPARGALSVRYPQVRFLGYRFKEELASLLAGADVMVFPSLTDTFGLAMIEALACGTPVAAFPVPGPVDVLEPGVTGVMDTDLALAVTGAARLDRKVCAARAAAFTWEAATAQFLEGLAPIGAAVRARLAVSRSSAMIARIGTRRQTGQAGDAN